MPRPLLSLLVLVSLVSSARTDDWLQYRGPGGLGVAFDRGLPIEWGPNKNLAWKTALPGPGGSSPIVVGNRVFVTCYTGYGVDTKDPGEMKDLKRHLLCLDRDSGKIRWTRTVDPVLPEARWQTYLNLHGYASSTPISDGKTVYVFFGKSGVFAFDLDGKMQWNASVGTGTSGWGSATSPVLYKDLLIVNASVESRSLVALERSSGKEVWRSKGIEESWSSPVLVKLSAGATELVVSGSRKLLGFDPDSGKELWHSDSFNWYVCPSPVAHDGVVYALQNSTCVAVRAGGRGDVTKTHTVWQKKFGTTVPSPVYHDGLLYFYAGLAYCLKADDGAVVYKERLKPSADSIYASPILADGKLYYVSRENGAFVLAAGPAYKLLAHNNLRPADDSIFNGSPAVSNSQLLLRSDRFLYCFGQGK
jgi:outer membrane protein assembly factor BamB